MPDTTAQFETLRDRHGDIIISANHPTDDGLAWAAGWSVGEIDRPDYWSSDFESVEVANRGDYEEYLPFYLDLINRGYLVAPVAVTDSHSHFQSEPGVNATFIGVGSNDVSESDNEDLKEAIRARRTIASRGVFLDMSVEPGSLVVGGAELEVEAQSPSWIVVDRLKLLENGVEVVEVSGTFATFNLEPDADASYIVIAEGDVAMNPISNDTPWALSSAILVDVAGDGWEAPLSDFEY
ncbi:MAG: hypothetical protein HN348_17595 [Proteobacteria bacterium]|nr:hypothetical protein [Pseudomonadota bacterium]